MLHLVVTPQHVSQVTDASWSPLTSTVFALTTVDGKVMIMIMMMIIFNDNDCKVHVYDLSVNKYSPLCVQAIVNR